MRKIKKIDDEENKVGKHDEGKEADKKKRKGRKVK